MPPKIVTARSMGLNFHQNQLTPLGPEKIVAGHYSATPTAKDWQEGVKAVRSFHRSHKARGWAGIGYHYVIPNDGAILCGRSTLHKGAHVLNHNSGAIGVNMPGTTGDTPTKRQARSFNWLLHNAHTSAMPRAHRTDVNLSTLPRKGHKEFPGQSTSCPGAYLGMYRRGGDPWIEPASDELPAGIVLPDVDNVIVVDVGGERRLFVDANLVDDGFAELEPDDEEFLAFMAAATDLAPVPEDPFTQADDDELESADDDEEPTLLAADPEFDEDLSDLIAEIAAEETQPVA